MSDPKQTAHPAPAPAETARQEGAQGRTGHAPAPQAPGDTVSDGAVDASDPNVTAEINSEIAEVADEVHANA